MTEQNKARTARGQKKIRRLYGALFVMGIVGAAAYFLLFPVGQRRSGARSSVELGHRDDGTALIEVLKEQYAVLSNDYDAVLAKLEAVSEKVKATEEAHTSVTGEVAKLTVELASARERLDYELEKNTSDEQDISDLTDKLLEATEALKTLKAKITETEAEQDQLMAERVPKVDYDDAVRKMDRLSDRVTEANQAHAEKMKDIQALTDELTGRDKQLAALRTALDARKVDRELMTSVLAAQLRLLEYDVDRAIHSLTQLHGEMEKGIEGGEALKPSDMKKYDGLILTCLTRLQQSRAAAEQ